MPRGNGSTQTCGTEQSQPTGWPAPNRQFDAPKVSGEGLATCDPVRYVRPKQTGGSGACPLRAAAAVIATYNFPSRFNRPVLSRQ